MKILLVDPPAKYLGVPHIGLLYLQAYLEKNGIPAEIFHGPLEGCSLRNLKKKYLSAHPEIVGITSATDARFTAFECAKVAKALLPDPTVIMGGPHVTITAEDTLLHIPWIDVVVRGEGEHTLLELCRKLEEGKDLSSVLGISYRDGDRIVHNPPRPLIQNLDELPFPAYNRALLDKCKRPETPEGKLPFAPIVTSRGCPFGCAFCSSSEFWGKRFRARSPSNVIAEIKYMIEKFNVRSFGFNDDVFTLVKNRVVEICKLIQEEKLDIWWYCDIRPDLVDKDLLATMKKAGCYNVSFGVESGCDFIRERILGKRITREQIMNVVKWCQELGISRNVNFMMSLPEETHENVLRTLEMMEKIRELDSSVPSLNNTIQFFILRVFPGTKIELIAKEKGLLPPNFSWSVKLDPRIHTRPASMATFGADTPIFIDKLSQEEIFEIFYEWARSEERIPLSNVVKKMPILLNQFRSIEGLKTLLNVAKAYFKFILLRHHKWLKSTVKLA